MPLIKNRSFYELNYSFGIYCSYANLLATSQLGKIEVVLNAVSEFKNRRWSAKTFIAVVQLDKVIDSKGSTAAGRGNQLLAVTYRSGHLF